MLNGFVPNSSVSPWDNILEELQQDPSLGPAEHQQWRGDSTMAEPHTPDTAHKPAHSQMEHLHFPKSLRKIPFFLQICQQLKTPQSQKGAGEHMRICRMDCLKCGISGEMTSWHTEILDKELKVAALEISPQRSLSVPWTPTVPQTSTLKCHKTRGSLHSCTKTICNLQGLRC